MTLSGNSSIAGLRSRAGTIRLSDLPTRNENVWGGGHQRFMVPWFAKLAPSLLE